MSRGPLFGAARAALSVALPFAVAAGGLFAARLGELNAFYRPLDSWLLWGYLAAALTVAAALIAGLATLTLTAAAAVSRSDFLASSRAARSSSLGALAAVLAALAARCASGGLWGLPRLLGVASVTWLGAGLLSWAILAALEPRPRLGRAVLFLIGAGVLGFFVNALPTPPAGGAAAAPMPVTTAPSRRVLLVGFDGLDPDILGRLMERGDLPTFRRLADEGFLARSTTLKQTLSPIIWTTIATGKPPEQHGILGFMAYRLPGMECVLQRFAESDGCGSGLMTWALDGARRIGIATRWPVTNNLRRVRALWEILSERGLRVAVVNWWASWPAERVNGALVSDRFHYAAMNRSRNLAGDAGLAYPSSLGALLAPFVVRPADLSPEEIRSFFRPTGGEGGAERVRTHESLNDWSQGREPMLLAFLSADHTHANVADHLLAQGEWDFAAVYFRGIDVASHLMGALSRLHGERAGKRFGDRYGGTLEAYYRFADGQLAALLARAGADTDVIVCSDHGFAWEPSRGFNHVETAPDGVFLFHGPDAARGRGQISVKDVAPTLLHLLGQPVPRDMEGRVRDEAFVADSRKPATFIASYENSARLPGRATEGEDDEDIREELRALGYVN